MIKHMSNPHGVPGWHAVFGIKFLLAIILMVLASGMVGRSKALAFTRTRNGVRISAVIAVAVVLLALYLGHAE